MIETRPKKTHERALLIGLEKQGVSKWDLRDSLEELAELANSAGAEVVDTITQKLPKPTAPYYIGKGKAEEIKDSFHEREVTSVIFDDELSPAQGRNLENLLARKVLDRTQLILDIFAQRARSREGRLQIELAQLQYLLPRLTRMWHHLSRQTGGIGTRGPGATQLEVDRRRVQERIARLERAVEAVDGVIKGLDAYGKQTLIVFNKIDNLPNRELADSYLKRFPGSVAISARTGEGVNKLVHALEDALSSWRLRSRFRIPSNESSLIAEIHRVGHVLELRYEGSDAMIVAHVPPHLEQKLAGYAARD